MEPLQKRGNVRIDLVDPPDTAVLGVPKRNIALDRSDGTLGFAPAARLWMLDSGDRFTSQHRVDLPDVAVIFTDLSLGCGKHGKSGRVVDLDLRQHAAADLDVYHLVKQRHFGTVSQLVAAEPCGRVQDRVDKLPVGARQGAGHLLVLPKLGFLGRIDRQIPIGECKEAQRQANGDNAGQGQMEITLQHVGLPCPGHRDRRTREHFAATAKETAPRAARPACQSIRRRRVRSDQKLHVWLAGGRRSRCVPASTLHARTIPSFLHFVSFAPPGPTTTGAERPGFQGWRDARHLTALPGF